MRAAVIGPAGLRAAVAARARQCGSLELVDLERDGGGAVTASSLDQRLGHAAIEAVACFAGDATCRPDADLVTAVCGACRHARVRAFVLISSAAAYGASPHNPGLMTEARTVPPAARDRVALAWRSLERVVRREFQESTTVLTILRPAATPSSESRDCFSRLLRSAVAFTLPGHDPTVQLLSLDDLADAVCRGFERRVAGVFNVAPDEPIPLRAAVRLLGRRRVAVPCAVRRATTAVARVVARSTAAEDLDYLRYSWTVSGDRARRELGFVPTRTSAEVAARIVRPPPPRPEAPPPYDPYGLDPRYIARFGRTVLGWLERYYWRIEVDGLQHVPVTGRAVLVGMHRGFMPLDGVMTLHVLVQHRGRIPRFLIHPGVGLRFPFLSNFMTKLGGVIACRENAAFVLDRDELLGVYPEGIRGAFTAYRRVYRIGPSWREDFVKMALRHQAPIIPFVTVGSAEIFPILGRIHWAWWRRLTDWPFFPLTPTFPLLPIPLPSKWHMQFLPPIHVQHVYPPEAANDRAVVSAISRQVKQQIEEAAQEMLRRRPSIFFGSIFPSPPPLEERRT